MTELDQPIFKADKLDLWALVFAMAFPTIVTLVYFIWLKDFESAFQQTAFGIGKILQFGFPVAWVWIRHRSKLTFSFRQMTQSGRPGDVAIGIGFGLLVVAGMFAVYFLVIDQTQIGSRLTAMVQEKVSGVGVDTYWKYVSLGIFYAAGHSFLEEYYWRWFVFDFLRKFVSAPTAIVVSSLGFMAHHVVLLGYFFSWQWIIWPLSLCIAIGGMFWAWQFKETGKLRPPWFSHMVVDAGIFTLGYFLIKDML